MTIPEYDKTSANGYIQASGYANRNAIGISNPIKDKKSTMFIETKDGKFFKKVWKLLCDSGIHHTVTWEHDGWTIELLPK